MKPKIIFFDCDGVLITSNTWNSILRVSGINIEENNRFYKSYYQGKITYEHLVETEIELLRKKFTREKYTNEIIKKIKLNEDAEGIIKFIKSQNIPITIISSGEKEYVEVVAKKLKIKLFRVNTYFKFDINGKFTDFDFHTEDPIAKIDHVKEVCKLFNCSPEETFFIGDSNNDLKAFDLTKHGILYKTKDPDCLKHAWRTVENLNEIKSLL